MPASELNDTSPARLMRLRSFIEANDLDPFNYLHLLLTGDVPSPIAIGNDLYVSRSEISSWRSGLVGNAMRRHSELMAKGGERYAR